MTTEELREKFRVLFRQAYINGYNAKCSGERWEQEDGSVELPDKLILIDTFFALEVCKKARLAFVVEDAELPEVPSCQAGHSRKEAYRDSQQDMLKAGYRQTEEIEVL